MKKYESPIIDLVRLDTSDILTASPGTEGPVVEVEDEMWAW